MKNVSNDVFLTFGLLLLGSSSISADSMAAEEIDKLVQELQLTPDNIVLRREIIRLALTSNPMPPVPEGARRYVARGTAAAKAAQSPSDFELAVPEFEHATNIAPWWDVAYFNLALVQDKVDDFRGAVANYNFYLSIDPNADNAQTIRTHIYELEFLAEQEAKHPRVRFVSSDDGIVKDKKTGLEWSQSDNGFAVRGKDAKRYCENKRDGWRLPSVDELEGIDDKGGIGATQCGSEICQISPLFHLTGYYFWSDTQNGTSLFGAKAWLYYFNDGHRGSLLWSVISTDARALCVRSR
jgi:tetratricopeptide (TPR) repeat protein